MTSKAFLQRVLIAFMAAMLFACSSGDDGSGNTTEVTATTPAPVVTVAGENPVTLAQGESYTDLGATATNNAGEAVQVTVSGEVDISKAGTYTLTYTAADSDGNITATTRIINVLDKTPPIITLIGEGTVTVEQGATYVESGATAKDDETDVDVVITGSVNTSTVGVYTVTYTATDSEENTAEITRTVNVVDTTPPVITLIGDNPVTVIQNTAYSESGATAKDGDVDVNVVITGEVNASVAGVYTVTYTATDSAGNSSDTSRTINVLVIPPVVIPPVVTPATGVTKIIINTTGINLEVNEPYKLVTESTEVEISDLDETTLEIDTDITEVVILANEYDEPILVGRKFAGDDDAEISLESTAEVFLLMSSEFFGISISDDKELSSRIRSHEDFSALGAKLKKSIETGSSCPLDHECSLSASILASEIISEISIADLIEE